MVCFSLELIINIIVYFHFHQRKQRLLLSLQVQRNIQNKKWFYIFINLEFQIDLPGVENYGFEGESSFMRCRYGGVASDSEEASKVGRYQLNFSLN